MTHNPSITALADQFLQSTLMRLGTDENKALEALQELHLERPDSTSTRDEFCREVHRLAEIRHLLVNRQLPDASRLVDSIISDEMSGADENLALHLLRPESQSLDTQEFSVFFAGLTSGIETIFEAAVDHPVGTIGMIVGGAIACAAFPVLGTAATVIGGLGAAMLVGSTTYHVIGACLSGSSVESLLETRRAGTSIGEIVSLLLPSLKAPSFARAVSSIPTALRQARTQIFNELFMSPLALETIGISREISKSMIKNFNLLMKHTTYTGTLNRSLKQVITGYQEILNLSTELAQNYLAMAVEQLCIHRVDITFNSVENFEEIGKGLLEIVGLVERLPDATTRRIWDHLLPVISHISEQMFDTTLREFLTTRNIDQLEKAIRLIQQLKTIFFGRAKLLFDEHRVQRVHLNRLQQILDIIQSGTTEVQGATTYRTASIPSIDRVQKLVDVIGSFLVDCATTSAISPAGTRRIPRIFFPAATSRPPTAASAQPSQRNATSWPYLD